MRASWSTPTSTFARWLFLRAATDRLARAPSLTPEEAESLAILRGLDNGTEQLVVLADRDGRPEVRQWADARDIAAGCMQVLDAPAAVGEAFNLSGAAPFSLDELVRYIAAKLGLRLRAGVPADSTSRLVPQLRESPGCVGLQPTPDRLRHG